MASLSYRRHWRGAVNASAATVSDFPPDVSAIDSERDVAPAWAPRTVAALRKLLLLPPDWNQHGARPVSSDAVVAVVDVLGSTMWHDSPAPAVVPLASGGLQLEWHLNMMDIELSVARQGEMSIFVRDRQSGEEWEGDTGIRLRLADAVECLTKRQRQQQP